MAKIKRIAYLMDYLNTASFQQESVEGVFDGLPEQGIELYLFLGGGILRSGTDDYAVQRNLVYDLITKEMFDGIIVSTTTGNFISLAEFETFLGRYDPIPIIFFGPGPTRYHQILVDNKQGMETIIRHFIHDHQYKKIAFITGPDGNKDAEERLQAYKNKLQEAGIKIDPNLIYTGDFTYDSGVSAVRVLLDERKVRFEALIASNDNMVLGAKEELEKRGYTIPDKIALAGFDDIIEASSVLPSITTAKQPFNLFGKKIIENFFKIFRGEQVPKIEYIPAQMIIRQSCGCFSSRITDEQLLYCDTSETDPRNFFATHKDSCLQQILTQLTAAEGILDKAELAELLDAFYRYIFEDQNEQVFNILRNNLMQAVEKNRDVDCWQDIITLIRHHCSPLFSTREIINKAENLFHQLRLLVNEIHISQKNRNTIKTRDQTDQITQVGESLANAIENKELRRVIYETFPTLGIKNFIFSEFTDSENLEQARLIASVRDGKNRELADTDEIVYPVRQIFPDNISRFNSKINFVIPLIFRENRLGFIVFEKYEGIQTIYTLLAGQLSRSLYTSRLIKKILNTESTIQERSNHIEELVLPMIDSIQSVKNLSDTQSAEAVNLNTISEQSNDKIRQSQKIMDDLRRILSETNLLVDSINDISETVDILSLNASIEAVHAGTYGKGFSVIATEIRNLSDKTKHNLHQINTFLGSISKGIKDFVIANQEVSQVFDKLRETISDITISLHEVSDKMMHLSDSSNTILQVMRKDQ